MSRDSEKASTIAIVPVPTTAKRHGKGHVGIRRGQAWSLHQVSVGNGTPCTMMQARPEIDIAQVP